MSTFNFPPVTKSVSTITANTTKYQFVPLSGWVPAIGVVNTKALITMTNSNAKLKVAMGLQKAITDPADPTNNELEWDSTQTLGADGRTVVNKDWAATLDKVMWVRFGLLVGGTDADTFASGTVTVQISGTDQ